MVKFIIYSLICLLVATPAFAGNDPTRPVFPQKSKIIKKKSQTKAKQPLTAIFTRNNQRYAIIEDQIYHKGDYYRGSKLIKITSNKVLLRSKQGTRQLILIHKIKK